jgi:glycine dehydrogenase
MNPSAPHPAGPSPTSPFAPLDTFARRHLGNDANRVSAMLHALRLDGLDDLISQTVPEDIRLGKPLNLPPAATESEALRELGALAALNRDPATVLNFIGQGYHGTLTPSVIARTILENPAWYTAYTPYQAEISQGRLEALLNFQTLVTDLTGLDVANASLLDEGTAVAEAMSLALHAARNADASAFAIAGEIHPQTRSVLETRASAIGVSLASVQPDSTELPADAFALLVQYPDSLGSIRCVQALVEKIHALGGIAIFAADPLALTVLPSPGKLGADVAVGSLQRFGVPMGFGGPHAAYMAVKDGLKRLLPGRLVGVSKDAAGQTAFRLSLQTREQHIRRDKATSNICTAQVLLAVMASMYALYHGPEGLRAIAHRVHALAATAADAFRTLGLQTPHHQFFDTVRVVCSDAVRQAVERGRNRIINVRTLPDGFCVSFDETHSLRDLEELVDAVARGVGRDVPVPVELPEAVAHPVREEPLLTHPIFSAHQTETQLLRYIRSLEAKDISLVHSMIPLGSCTMKLNAASEMLPISWASFAALHPFAPATQSLGYAEMATQLERWLAEITGFAAVSLEPNAGSQGEYAGLLAIRGYHAARNEPHRDLCLIPVSAHGTNPASAVMAGLKVVTVKCLPNGDIDTEDLQHHLASHGPRVAALMVTYPSTHGVFEASIRQICDRVHAAGGQVYMDGANLNAQVGLCRPGDFGADVCHLNLHKTFCIPHGGGGPGVGPVAVAAHLAPYLPQRGIQGQGTRAGAVSAAPLGSASILPIPWMYVRMMGPHGLATASAHAILSANYIAERLHPFFPVLYRGSKGRVAHECIIDIRPYHSVTAEDVAKRLMDFGFHAPTLSWPVAGTLMIEPTESESKEEIDRLCDALIAIHGEILQIENGLIPASESPLKNAPHTAAMVCQSDWTLPYTREQAAFPAPWTRASKVWPSVRRIDNVWGDRNLFCACVPTAGG